MDKIKEIHEFWFGSYSDASDLSQDHTLTKRWFSKNPSFDATITKQFAKEHEKAKSGAYTNWQDTPHGTLSLIILCDQFPRNMFREDARAFETDALAVSLTYHAIETKQIAELMLLERYVLCLPLMHSEAIEDQNECIKQYEWLIDTSKEKSPQNTVIYINALDYAKRHAKIIEQFGRFPHRNEILSRPSTPKEVDFLKQPGSSF